MKNISLSLILLLINIQANNAQKIMTFQEMEKNGLSMAKLDSTFHNASDAGSVPGVFTGKKSKKFSKAWGSFYKDLMTYCGKNGLIWGKQTYCFNKIYFSPTGEVAYWFFNFKKADNIPQEKQDLYLKILKQYSSAHKLKIKASVPYSQCASVDFIDL
jgi:hypothetical protein